jgi:predicted PurR-regulated permease PerM
MSARAKQDARPPLPAGTQTRDAARLTLALLLTLLALWVAGDFLHSVGWAVVVAVAAWPAYRRFARRLPAQHAQIVAPVVFTALLGIAVFIPVAIAIHEAANESRDLLRWLAEIREKGLPAPAWLPSLPLGEHAMRWWSANLADPNGAKEFFGSGTDKAANAAWARFFGGELLHRTFHFVVCLIATFSLLRGGPALGNRILDAADRFFGDPGERLARKLVETVRGTVNGTLLVAVGEGVVIGAGYVVAGVPKPYLFAVLTAAFAMVPLGAWVVFTSAALLLVAAGGTPAAAIGVFAFGALVMIVGDLWVWPALVGNQARLPFLIALIGILGGVQTFGLIGLFVGPVILAGFWVVVRDWVLQPRRQDSS